MMNTGEADTFLQLNMLDAKYLLNHLATLL